MGLKTRSMIAALVAIVAGLWHFRSIALATAHVPAGSFPFVPAAITTTAVMLSLYWWGKAREGDE